MNLPATTARGAAESAVSRALPTARATMTARIWGLDWGSILPWQLDDEVRVEFASLADVTPFIERIYPQTFNTTRRWLVEPMTEAKRRFGEEMDVFAFRTDREIVGVLAGHPSDWSTYYWRTVALSPDHRGKHLLTAFAERCYAPFREAGVKRMDVDTCPANPATVRLFSGQGFLVTSTISSERWGLSLRFTKFLDEEAERVYRAQFLDVPAGPRPHNTEDERRHR